MGRRLRVLGALALFGVGFEGFISAHALSYHFVIRNNAQRAAVLAGTRHGYLGRVGLMALVGLVLAACASFALGLVDRKAVAPSGWQAFRRLALIQMGSYLCLESIERFQYSSMNQRWLAPLLLTGLLLQLVAAALAVVVVRVLGLLGRALARAVAARPREHSEAPSFVVLAVEFASAALAPGRGPRAPPLLLVAHS